MVNITNNKIGDIMKKKTILFIFIVIIMIAWMIPSGSDEFRIRVIANSDTSADQYEKMVIVEELNVFIGTLNKEDIVAEIKSHMVEINDILRKYLNYKEYSLSIQKAKFPAKEINGQIIPGGRYETLLIIIGKGEGKNWWSLLYPDYHGLCFEDLQTDDVEYKSYFWEELKKLLFNDSFAYIVPAGDLLGNKIG